MSALPSVTHILKEVGLGPEFDFVDPVTLEAACLRGTAVHEAIEAHAYGYLDEATLSPIAAPYLDGYKKFLSESGHEPIATEIEVIHPSWGYIGHLDRVGWLIGKRAILDFKTPESLDLKPAGYQLALYRLAWNAQHPDQPVDVIGVLQLKSDGTYRFHDLNPAVYEQVALAAVIVYRARKER